MEKFENNEILRDWDPRSSPPQGISLENLRKRGLDTVRIQFTLPTFSLRLVGDGLPALCIVAALAIRPSITTLVLALLATGYLGYHIKRRLKSTEKWQINISTDLLTISRTGDNGDTLLEQSFSFSDISDISVERGRIGSRSCVKISTASGPVEFGKGLSDEALYWLNNFLEMELAGLTWRPLHGIDRRHSRARGSMVTNPVLLKPELAQRLIAIFLAEAPIILERLQGAVEGKDAETIRYGAHWLKTSSANVGGKSLSELAQRLEALARDKDFGQMTALLPEIERKSTELMAWLQDPANAAADSIAYLPLAEEDALGGWQQASSPSAPAVPEDHTDEAPAVERRNARVLVVDDSGVSREIARDFLEEFVTDVCVANDGIEALDQLNKQRFDLVLMDCEMYGLNGYQCTRRLRTLESLSGAPRIPVIATTGHAQKGDRARCLDAGMDDYLCKPYSPEGLREKVLHWLDAAKRAADEAAAAAAAAKAEAEAAEANSPEAAPAHMSAAEAAAAAVEGATDAFNQRSSAAA